MGLSLAERDRRLNAARNEMRARGLAALVVAGNTARKGYLQYLANYNIPIDYCYMVLPLEGDPTLFVFTPNQERNAPSRSWVADARYSPDYGAGIAGRLRELGVAEKTVGVAGMDVLTARAYRTIVAALPSVKLVDAGDILDEARLTKSDEELAIIRQSAVLAEGACAAARSAVRPGRTDHDVFAEMEYFLRRRGVIEAFNLVTAGLGPAFPSLPGGQLLKDGEAVLLEITPRHQGYYAQLTTAAAIGRANPEREKMAELARRALEKAVAVLRPGTRACDVDAAMRAVVEGAGCTMPQRAGHGVGLEVSEGPPLIPSNRAPLRPGMVLAVHPSVLSSNGVGVFLGGSYLITQHVYEQLYTTDLT